MVRFFFISALLLTNTFVVQQQKLRLEDIFYSNKFYEKKIENVHWSPDESLEAKLKQFDLMIYPNRNHRISGGITQLHLFTLIGNYFFNHL
jgi:hypothetical protein